MQLQNFKEYIILNVMEGKQSQSLCASVSWFPVKIGRGIPFAPHPFPSSEPQRYKGFSPLPYRFCSASSKSKKLAACGYAVVCLLQARRLGLFEEEVLQDSGVQIFTSGLSGSDPQAHVWLEKKSLPL